MAFTLLKPTGIDLSQTFAFTGSVSGAGGGKVLQVIQVENLTDLSLSSDTYTDFFSGTITPSATSSKVLAFWTVHSRFMGAIRGFGTRLVRDSTNVWTSTRDYYIYTEDSAQDRHSTMFSYLDSPSKNTSTTYKIQVAAHSDDSIDFSGNSNQSNLTLMEISA